VTVLAWSVVLPLLLLPVVCTHVVPVPVVLVLVRSAVRGFPHGYENRLCVGARIADSGVVNLPATEPLARCDNSAVVPVEPSVVLPPLLLPAEYTHVVPVPAVWVLVCFVVCGTFPDAGTAGVGRSCGDSGVIGGVAAAFVAC